MSQASCIPVSEVAAPLPAASPLLEARRLGEDLSFGNLRLAASHILLAPPGGAAVAVAGLNPISPSHTVVLPRRSVPRLGDLSDAELSDFCKTLWSAKSVLDSSLSGVSAYNLAILDGASASQPFDHIHAHIIPRWPQDELGNDKVHAAVEAWAPDTRVAPPVPWPGPEDKERRPRDAEVMAEEASRYRKRLIAKNEVASEVRLLSPLGKIRKRLRSREGVFQRSRRPESMYLRLCFVDLHLRLFDPACSYVVIACASQGRTPNKFCLGSYPKNNA